MITLRKMTQDEYEAWRPVSIAGYAGEHVHAGNWTAEEAPEQAEKAFDHYLPDGLGTAGHCICAVVDATTGANVGRLWYFIEPTKAGPRVFIADVGIDEPHRRKGYASAALRELEREAVRLEADSIRLHVFGNNTAARNLYARRGYAETDVQMVKTLAA